MKRKDCFFGLHFDFHANKDTKDIGVNFDEKVLRKIIDEVKPDFIQCDTKGHPGYASYKTELNNSAPNLKTDLLEKFRKITKEKGVLLFSHYSGIWDKKATKEHEEWAIKDKDGKATDRVSVFSEYADKLLIPQLKEIATKYGVDGAWVDGDCWALLYDFSENAKIKWNKKTGKNLDDLHEGDKDFDSYVEFLRQGFFDYVRHYIEEVKKVAPNFEITSNWLNSGWAPNVSFLTDYISGDLSPTNSVAIARCTARIMQAVGIPFDIMSWGISFPVHYPKNAIQLCQEASVIISLGGGFQIYNMQSPQNTVMDEWAIGEWAKVSAFVKERQPYCQFSSPISDVGVLYSSKAYYKQTDGIFNVNSKYNEDYSGVLTALLDTGYSVSTIIAEKENIDFSSYKTIAVSNTNYLDNGVIERLITYVKDGGRLILFGDDTTKLFAKRIDITYEERQNEKPITTVFGDGYLLEIRHPYLLIDKDGESKNIFMAENLVDGDLDESNPPPSIRQGNRKVPALSSFELGKGKVGVCPIRIGKFYLSERTWELQKFISDSFSLVGEFTAKTDKPTLVDILLTKKDDRKFVHLINLTGEHQNPSVMTYRDLPPVYDIGVKIKTQEKVKKVINVLDGKKIKFKLKNGVLEFRIDKLEIHDVIEII